MKRNSRNIRVNTIRRTASKVPGVPGNVLINDEWFSSRELRNCLIGAGLNANIPVLALKGAVVKCETIEIEQSDIDQSPEGVKLTLQGREVTFKKVGKNNVNLDIDFTSVNVTDNLLNLAKLSQMYPRQAAAPAPSTTATPVQTEVIEGDNVAETAAPAQAGQAAVEHEDIHEETATPAANPTPVTQ